MAQSFITHRIRISVCQPGFHIFLSSMAPFLSFGQIKLTVLGQLLPYVLLHRRLISRSEAGPLRTSYWPVHLYHTQVFLYVIDMYTIHLIYGKSASGVSRILVTGC